MDGLSLNGNRAANRKQRPTVRKALLLVFTFLLWVLLFALQKPVFLLAYGGLGSVFAVVWHGLPLDMSMAGYLTALPGLVLLVSALPLRCLRGKKAERILLWTVRLWFAVASVIVALAFVANMGLYGYWRFPLDSTPIFFILSSPSAAMASVEWWQWIAGIAGIVAVAAVIGLAFHLLWMKWGRGVLAGRVSLTQWIPLLLLEALLFLPIRGGVTVSTMNTGKAYFSQDETLNHAAVNPLFSFMESMAHQEDFARQYRFMDDKVAHKLYKEMMQPVKTDSARVNVLGGLGQTAKRPDVYIVILESFSDTLTRVPGVTPNLNRMKGEGVYFSNFYANGFRTDRGLVSILLGYPSPGAVSLMKYPRKTAKLPSIASHLKSAGYGLHYYYGGDADFTNMRSFLINQGFEKITADVDFPVGERLSKWGVPDHLLFKRVEEDFADAKSGKPRLTVIQTSSSHEPFDVPYHRLGDKVLNAFAYTDDCLGKFVGFLRKSGKWDNSLVIMVPDHLGAWPSNIDNFASWRFHVPMIWTGGAIDNRRCPYNVDTFGSQQDIAATLLGQLGIGHDDMTFSKDMLDPSASHFAYFMMNDGFGLKTATDEVIYDNKQRRVVVDKGRGGANCLKYGQALLQVLFDDIAEK